MKHNNVSLNAIETISYGLLIGAAVALVFYLFHSQPVSYTIFLITEGQWGEYFTSISFGLSSMLLIALLFKPARRSQKVVWAMIGLTAFFIGAEEISLGQGILHIPKPSFFTIPTYKMSLIFTTSNICRTYLIIGFWLILCSGG